MSCGHQYSLAKNLYKHYRQRSDALHEKLAVAVAAAFGARSCKICHKDFKTLKNWKTHMIQRHKRSPLVETLSISQRTELQLRQRNSKVDPAVLDPRPFKGQTPLLPDNQCQDYDQPCRSGVGHPALAPAYSGHTTVIQTGDLRSNEGLYTISGQANTYITAGLAREDNFNRLSVPLCQRPYGSPIFMHVIRGNISGVYTIISQGGGSLWDHDPYGLGLLYVGYYQQV